MATDAIVFACANPVPEIWPWEAQEAGARIVATGRSDFPNQVNNSLVFPGLFRGVLEVRARAISDGMAIAAAQELAAAARVQGLRADRILTEMSDWRIAARLAAATADAAEREGLATLPLGRDAVYRRACAAIAAVQDAVRVLSREGIIPAPPER
jgi:malate dehydrogenase (oxaloacetate-decarboxylating)